MHWPLLSCGCAAAQARGGCRPRRSRARQACRRGLLQRPQALRFGGVGGQEGEEGRQGEVLNAEEPPRALHAATHACMQPGAPRGAVPGYRPVRAARTGMQVES